MKLQRVIHILEDGRRKYVTHRGAIVKWTHIEVEVMACNYYRFGYAAYTADLTAYDVTIAGLRQRFPDAPLVRVIGFVFEDHDMPLREGVIINP